MLKLILTKYFFSPAQNSQGILTLAKFPALPYSENIGNNDNSSTCLIGHYDILTTTVQFYVMVAKVPR